MRTRVELDNLDNSVPREPGIYEIFLKSGAGLKVGIAGDLLTRLKTHSASRQSGLQLKPGGNWSIPSDVESKASILAKHLFFDATIAPEYDLKSEGGRRSFLLQKCFAIFEVMEGLEAAKAQEKERESSGKFRYVGDVICR